MFYQLPNGNVLYLTLEEYLNFTDEELEELSRNNFGEPISSKTHYYKHIIKKKSKINSIQDIDYTPDEDDTNTAGPLNIDNLKS